MVKQTNDSQITYYCSTEDEVATIPVAEIGATVYVVNGGILYMSDGTSWVEQ